MRGSRQALEVKQAIDDNEVAACDDDMQTAAAACVCSRGSGWETNLDR